MRFFYCSFFIFLNLIILGQKKQVYYEMGRPNPLDYNIAKRIIGKELKLVFVYAGRNMIDSLGIEHFEKSNRSVREKKSKKHGDNWNFEFNKEVDNELTIHQSLRSIIKNSEEYKSQTLNELYILFDRKKCCVKKYSAYLVGRILIGDQYEMKVLYKMKIDAKTKVIKKVIDKDMPLPFTFEENGIY